LIAKQAGAMITDFSGEKFSIYENQVLVTNKKLHKPMINILEKII
jgi:fructose-1,6-bisphosphatase/inositol monophosphatase family enzyme